PSRRGSARSARRSRGRSIACSAKASSSSVGRRSWCSISARSRPSPTSERMRMRAPPRTTAAALLTAAVLVSACARDEAEPAPNSLAALDAEWPPHTASCQARMAEGLREPEPLPDGPHVAAYEHVWRTIAEKHYDPTLACLDWVALRKHYGQKVADAGTDATTAYAAINELLGLLGQSHLHATAPSGS